MTWGQLLRMISLNGKLIIRFKNEYLSHNFASSSSKEEKPLQKLFVFHPKYIEIFLQRAIFINGIQPKKLFFNKILSLKKSGQ